MLKLKNLIAKFGGPHPDRLKEGSTYAGFALLYAALGLPAEYLDMLVALVAQLLPPAIAPVATQALLGAIGVALVFLKARKGDGGTVRLPASAFFLAVALMMLSACAGDTKLLGGYLVSTNNPQNFAGLNQWTVQSCNAEGQCVKGSFLDGKESEKKQMAVQLADGTIIKYSTGGERAFEGFKTRADVEKYVMATFGQLVPGLVDAIAKTQGLE